MVKVSIIVPIYNVEPYIERCLQSVMAQTYSNIECILVDDCTPDNSMDICRQLLTSYLGSIDFKIQHHNYNRGLSAARNTGTAAATGDYIYYLDSDDIISSNCIETLIEEVDKYPNTEMVCGRSEPADKVYATKQYVRLTNNEEIRLQYLSHQQAFPVPAWNKLVRRDFILNNNLFFKEGIIHEDVLWTFHVIQKLASVSLLPQTTYHYFQREQSIVYATPTARRANSMMSILYEIAKSADEPFFLLTIYKFLLRTFDWFRHSTTSNIKTYYAFARALCYKRKYRLAIIYFCFFFLCPLKHGHRLEKTIYKRIFTLYTIEQNLQIQTNKNGSN